MIIIIILIKKNKENKKNKGSPLVGYGVALIRRCFFIMRRERKERSRDIRID
jgi:hypothetical protein